MPYGLGFDKFAKFNPLLVALLFGLFWLNVLLGKAKISFGWDVPFLLGDVPEYLLLLFTALFFTLMALNSERNAEDGSDSAPSKKNNNHSFNSTGEKK